MCQGDLISHSQCSGVRSLRRRRLHLLKLFDPSTPEPLSFPFREPCKAALVYTATIRTALESVSRGRVSGETRCACAPVKEEVKRKTAFGGFPSHSSCGDPLLRCCVFWREELDTILGFFSLSRFPPTEPILSFQCTLVYVLRCLLGLLVNFLLGGGRLFSTFIPFLHPQVSVCSTISTVSEKRLLYLFCVGFYSIQALFFATGSESSSFYL